MRIDQKLYEAARLREYLHCYRLVLGVQNLYEAVITSLSFHNPFEIGLPSFSSKCGHVTEKHVPIGCKHEMLGNQTYEVSQPLSKLSRQSLKLFDCRYVFDKQIRPKLQTRYSSVQGFQK